MSWRDYDPTRRQALVTLGLSAAAVALTGVEPIAQRPPATMIRPPGAQQTEFGALCIRCGACVRVCPTQGLQPSLFEGSVQNVLTPRLVPRLGYCSYGCNACGQVCPTAAIPPLALEVKQQAVIGLASIDVGRCLPWAHNIPCIVCEEVCPVADKAILLDDVEALDFQGQTVMLQRPRVVLELCIGCGICEYQCPMGGEAAIRIYAPTDLGGQARVSGKVTQRDLSRGSQEVLRHHADWLLSDLLGNLMIEIARERDVPHTEWWLHDRSGDIAL